MPLVAAVARSQQQNSVLSFVSAPLLSGAADAAHDAGLVWKDD
jgi:hypothetical protein